MGCRCHTPGESAAVLTWLQSILLLSHSGIVAQCNTSCLVHLCFCFGAAQELVCWDLSWT